MEKNLNLQDCNIELQDKVKVFCEDGFRWPIRGFSFHIDKGNPSPIWYDPHESDLMLKLV